MAQTVVSVWIGNTDSEEKLEAYTEPVYSEDGADISAPFLEDFGIDQDDFDEDFFECAMHAAPTDSLAVLLAGCSYDDTVIPAMQAQTGDKLPFPCNAMILLYDFAYTGGIAEKSGFRFLGSTAAETDA